MHARLRVHKRKESMFSFSHLNTALTNVLINFLIEVFGFT